MPSPTRRRTAVAATLTTMLALILVPLTANTASADGHPTLSLTTTSGTNLSSDDIESFNSFTDVNLICPDTSSAAVAFIARPGQEIQPVPDPSVKAHLLPGVVASTSGSSRTTYAVDPETHVVTGDLSLGVEHSFQDISNSGNQLPGELQDPSLAGVTQVSLGLMCVVSNSDRTVAAGVDGNTVAAWTTLTYDLGADTWSVPAPKIDTTVAVSADATGANGATLTALISAGGSQASDTTGTVEFFDNTPTTVSVGTASVSGGIATKSLTGLATGNHSYSATYTPASDDSKYNGSSSTADAPLTVTAPKTDVTVSLAGTANGTDSATFTATIKAAGTVATASTGSIEFWSGGVKKGEVPISNGVASYTATNLTAGQTYSYTAKYAGDSLYNAADSAASSVTLPAAPTPLAAGDAVVPGTTYVVTVPAATFTAGETVKGEIHSDPIVLPETTTAAGDGSAVYTFTAPASLPSGDHELVLTGATSAASFSLAFAVAAAPADDPGANDPGANDAVSFGTDWIAATASTPAGAAGLIAVLLLVLGGGTAGGWTYLRRRAARVRG